MEKRRSESVYWSLDDNLDVVYTNGFSSDGSNSQSSQCLALVSSYGELQGMITTQNEDFDTFQSCGIFSKPEFLSKEIENIALPLPTWGQRLVYNAKNQLD